MKNDISDINEKRLSKFKDFEETYLKALYSIPKDKQDYTPLYEIALKLVRLIEPQEKICMEVAPYKKDVSIFLFSGGDLRVNRGCREILLNHLKCLQCEGIKGYSLHIEGDYDNFMFWKDTKVQFLNK